MMTDQQEETNVRQYVAELKKLYQDILVSCCIFVLALLAWMATGGGFWPLWLFLAFGLQVLVRLISMGKVPLSDVNFWLRWVSFLTPEWQERQVAKLMKESGKSHRNWNADEHEQENFNVKHEETVAPKPFPKKKTPPLNKAKPQGPKTPPVLPSQKP